jgi:hypothetical protein
MAPSKMLQILMPKPSWIQQESSFTQIPLEQVIAKLERQFIRIKVEGVDTSKLLQEVLLIPTKNCASSSYNSIEIKLQD